MIKVAILVDGGYFLKRYRHLNQSNESFNPYDAKQTATDLHNGIMAHLKSKNKKYRGYLYRIFYYDCYPLDKKHHNPLTKRPIDFGKSKLAQFKLSLFNELRRMRKVALRLGYLRDNNNWILSPDKTKALLAKDISVDDLEESDVRLDLKQAGVDMKIGLDIASLAYKQLVDKIVLIAGDSDFVPAAKTARREGIDFVLDPMWNKIDPSLFEHIDGLRSTWHRHENEKCRH